MTLIRRSFFSFVSLLVLVYSAFLPGCSSFNSSKDESWSSGEMKEIKGSVRIISVSVERSGEWSSLEKEINDLLPLLFSEESYLVVSPSCLSDYSATVKAREREYPDEWQMSRSLSVEIRLWAAGETDGIEPLPLSAGRSIAHGTQSLASSGVLSDMLRKAVKNAVNGLPHTEDPPADAPSGRELDQ